jgi:magnesium transporter
MLKELLQTENKKGLIEFIEETHAHDLASLFNELNDDEKAKVFELLSSEKLAELVSYLEADDAADVLADLDIEKQVELVEMMEPDDAADVIQELEKDEKSELIEKLSEDSDILELIGYDEDETGSAMTNLLIEIHPKMDVKEATKKVIKEANEVESINTLFITEDDGRYVGSIPLRILLKAKSPLEVGELIEEYPFVYDKDPISKTIQSIRNYGIYEMPVLDKDLKLVGMITLDDALDIYQEEAQEDYEKLAALPETDEEHGSIRTALHRLPWLLSLLIVSIPLSMVTRQFEHIITAVAILIVFQPLILGSAGNVATQTLAVTLKMIASHEKGIFRNSFREIITGVLNGLVIGSIAFLITYLFSFINTSMTDHAITISLIIGLSLWVMLSLAPVLAILIPLTLHSLKIDPAVASGPFITTLIDVTASLVYFGMATILLGGIV